MPYGPGGTFTAISLPGSFNPAIGTQQATPEAWNLLLADLTGGLTQAITKNGLTTATANLPMGGFRHTGVGDSTARTMYAPTGQVQDNSFAYGTAGGTADAATLTLAPAITAYKVGQVFAYIAPGTTTITNPTLNVNGVGAGVISLPGGGALPVGGILSGGIVSVSVTSLTPTFQLNLGRAPLSTAGGTVTGTLTMSGAAINEAVRVDVASAATADIGAAAANYVRITGTTTITGLGTIASGARRKVVFAGALTLTHSATLILPTSANITTASGDCAEFESEGAGTWRCTDYQRANGQALQVQQYAQAFCTVSGGVLTTQKQTGFTSIVRDSTGRFTCTMSTAMPDVNYTVVGTAQIDRAASSWNGLMFSEDIGPGARSTTVFHLITGADNIDVQDPTALNIRVYA